MRLISCDDCGKPTRDIKLNTKRGKEKREGTR